MKNKQHILIPVRIIFLLSLVGGLYLVFKNDVTTFVDENPKEEKQLETTKSYDLNPTDNKTVKQVIQEKVDHGRDKISKKLGNGKEGSISQKIGVKKKLSKAEIATLNELSKSNPPAFLHRIRTLLSENYSSHPVENAIHRILKESYETINYNLLEGLSGSPIASFYFAIRGWKDVQKKEHPANEGSKWNSIERKLEYASKNNIEEAKYLLATLSLSRVPSRMRSKRALTLLSQVKSLNFYNKQPYGLSNPYTLFVGAREPFYSREFYLALALHWNSASMLSLQKLNPKSDKLQKVIEYIEGKSPKYLDPSLKAQELANMARSSYKKVIEKASGNEFFIAQLLLVTLNDDPTINEPITFDINRENGEKLFNSLYTKYSHDFEKYCLYIKDHTPSRNGLSKFTQYLDRIELEKKNKETKRLRFINRPGSEKIRTANEGYFQDKNKVCKGIIYHKHKDTYISDTRKGDSSKGPWVFNTAIITLNDNSNFLEYSQYYYEHDGRGNAILKSVTPIEKVNLKQKITPLNGIIHPYFNEKKQWNGKFSGGVWLYEGANTKQHKAQLLKSADKLKIWPRIYNRNSNLWYFVTKNENGLGGFVLAHKVKILDNSVNWAVGIPSSEKDIILNPFSLDPKNSKLNISDEKRGNILLDDYGRKVVVP